MTWTFTDKPATRTIDRLRILIGDTDESDQLLSDETLNWLSTQYGNVYSTAAAAAEAIASKYARYVNKKVGDLSLNSGDRAKHYYDLATTLRAQAARRAAVPYAGGISIADKETQLDDSDRVLPKFTRDMQEYGNDQAPGAVLSEWDS